MSVSSRIAAVAVSAVVASGVAAAGAAAQTPAPAPASPGDTVVTPGAPAPTDASRNDNNNSCFLHVKSQQREEDDDDLPVGYTLKCATPITGYTISVSAGPRTPLVTGFETEVFALQKGTGAVLPDQSFSCNGDQPGWGVNCVGVYGGAYATIPGTFTLAAAGDNLRAYPNVTITASVFRATNVPDGKGGFKKNADGSPTITSAVAGPFAAKVDDPSLRAGAKARAKRRLAARAKTRRAKQRAAARAHRS